MGRKGCTPSLLPQYWPIGVLYKGPLQGACMQTNNLIIFWRHPKLQAILLCQQPTQAALAHWVLITEGVVLSLNDTGEAS